MDSTLASFRFKPDFVP
jgi:hypothetical protein